MLTTQSRFSAVLAVAGAATLIAGCGGSSKPPSSGGGSQATGGGPPKSAITAAYKFSRCMRQHGVADFPDPVVHSSATSQMIGIKVTPGLTGSPHYTSAQKACAGIMPGPGNSNVGPSPQQQAAREKGLLGFANCMRHHQVPAFPDPDSHGQLSIQKVNAAGIDLHAPAVKTAALACVPASDGQITAAAVARAVNGGS